MDAKKKGLKLHWQILIAIVLACICGIWTGKSTSIWGVNFYEVYNFIGTIFLNALKMIIVPLIMASIICGVASISDNKSLGRLGTKTILYYMFTSLLAILVGLVLVNLIAPGIIDGHPAGQALGLTQNAQLFASQLKDKGFRDIVEIFTRMVPANIVKAAVNGELLGIIFFSFLFGYFMMKVTKEYAITVKNFWQAVFETMMLITMLIMRFAPIGVFGLVAKTIAVTGFSAFIPLLSFFITVLLALAIHMFIVLPLMLKLIGRIKPLRQFKAMSPAILMAFSTSSSSATLPLTMECVEKNAKVSNRTTSFVLPLGATINMDGTALYECVAAIFIAQAYGLHLSFTTQFIIVFVALLTSVGVAGIPAASLVAITIILGTIGLPLSAIGIILVTDRFLDMCRTAVNVFSDSCGAVIIGRTEGEKQILAGSGPATNLI